MALDEPKLRILRMKDSTQMPGSEVFGKTVRIERAVDDPTSALLAKWMDTVFVIPGTKIRFGFDSLIDLFPGVGDAIGAVISTYIIAQGSRLGVPKVILVRMAMNVLTNALLGIIPILGAIFSVFYRSNVKNYELLRRYAGRQKARASDWLFVVGFALLMLVLAAGMIIVVVMVIRKILATT